MYFPGVEVALVVVGMEYVVVAIGRVIRLRKYVSFSIKREAKQENTYEWRGAVIHPTPQCVSNCAQDENSYQLAGVPRYGALVLRRGSSKAGSVRPQ